MKRKILKKMQYKMMNVGIELNKLESLSRILIEPVQGGENLKPWDNENLSRIMADKISYTKRNFNKIEEILEFKI